jgi:hypothetical protein
VRVRERALLTSHSSRNHHTATDDELVAGLLKRGRTRRTKSRASSRRLVEDLHRWDVNQVARVGVHRVRIQNLVVQVEARGGAGAFIRLSLPGLPDVSRTWRLVPVSQARDRIPQFQGKTSYLIVGKDRRKYRHLYFDPATGECGTRTDLHLKYTTQRETVRRRRAWKLMKARARLEQWKRETHKYRELRQAVRRLNDAI